MLQGQHLVHSPVITFVDLSNQSIVDVSDTPVAEHIIEATVFTGTSSPFTTKPDKKTYCTSRKVGSLIIS